jgi:asparagine synthase (glutamine-hydrolysing)
MDGKFAFMLYDETKDFLFIGRDHMGLCPLYWGKNKDGSIYAASELKGIEGLCENYQPFPPGFIYTSTQGLQRWYDPSWQYVIP